MQLRLEPRWKMQLCRCGHNQEHHRSLDTNAITYCRQCGCMAFDRRPAPPLQCLFCDFQGTKDELIAHSTACEKHPLWKEAREQRERADSNWESLVRIKDKLSSHHTELAASRAQVAKLGGELEVAKATISQARSILFSYTDNEITADPWWGVVRNGSFGRMVMLEGPFFSRERATQLLEARRYEYGAKAYVYCYSGHRSQHFKDLREVLWPLAQEPPCQG